MAEPALHILNFRWENGGKHGSKFVCPEFQTFLHCLVRANILLKIAKIFAAKNSQIY